MPPFIPRCKICGKKRIKVAAYCKKHWQKERQKQDQKSKIILNDKYWITRANNA